MSRPDASGPRPVRLLLALAAGLLALAGAAAAETRVTASLAPQSISQDDVCRLSITVSGGLLRSLQEPTLPALDGLQVLGASTEQAMSLVNGAMQSSYSFVYTLAPTREGTLTIPAIPVTVGGKTYRTTPQSLEVTAAAGGSPGGGMMPTAPNPFAPDPDVGPSPEEAVAVRHSVDCKTAYVGQQITYTFTFYQGETLSGDINYRPADIPGLVPEALPNPPPATETLDGRTYNTQCRPQALFATKPGKHTIGKAVVTVQLDPFTGPQQFVAEPLTINVLPLPEAGQPAGFGGAVGRFRVTLSADRTAVRAGETVNLQALVEGVGNVQSLGAPRITVPEWVRLYQAGEARKAEPGGGGGGPTAIGGTATFSYLVLPKQEGTLKLGPVAYPYFDPASRSYKVAYSNALTVAVSRGVVGADEAAASGSGLRPLRSRPGRPIRPPLTQSWWFWVLQAIPLALVSWAGWRRWGQAVLAADPRQARAGHALALARRRLAEAERCLAAGDCDTTHAALHAALCDYVADRLGAPPAGLTADTVRQLLLDASCPAALADRAQELLQRAAGGRFAPGGTDPERARQTLGEAAELLAALQKEVRATRGDE